MSSTYDAGRNIGLEILAIHPFPGGELAEYPALVIAGLDPAIYPLRKSLFEE
jgi:hypothetical protein